MTLLAQLVGVSRRIGANSARLGQAGAGARGGEPSLSIAEVDASLTAITALRGAGSAAQRAQALGTLFSRATAAERQFLMGLLLGELRQGALAGGMVQAIAAAADRPGERVRRVARYAPNRG